jgi:hypothetical protein
MGNFINYIWIALLIIYIISPFDAHPLFFDDLIASGVLFYYLYKNSRRKKQYEKYYSNYGQSKSEKSSDQNKFSGSQGPATLKEAYRLLGLNQNASLDELSRAYKLKIAKSHPDKVSHLSEELQDKAKELTLRLNEAFDLIKRYRKN